MKFNFSFNPNTHDFWEIFASIKKYYPIGLEKKEGTGIYFKYHGIKELEKIVIDNVHDKKNYKERWVIFTDEIGKELNKKIQGTTYGQTPSFSSSIILLRNQFETCMHTKELHFAVSLVGGFFQIYGLDITTIIDKEGSRGYSHVNVVTTSPFKEYQESFEHVENRLREKYPKHKIVPFVFGQTAINGLEVRYLDGENCSINEALFNNFLSEDKISRSIRGDKYYGKDDWLKKEH